jgi:hypothetical protein
MNQSRFQIGCLLLTAVASLATLLFLLAGALHLWNALAHLDWLRERVAMSRLTFFGWTTAIWVAAAFAQRARLRQHGLGHGGAA